ncbi:uncharacterized protein MYCFIDRAFT_172527 [Pseudocercospora fijiensis CIRAD86]|uniref:Uncharacterized protein n=1 Tax=Pseudocercospora fijiensis (strain CIRAD86) TaxID=383855 RepID=M3BC33_PSEFD|nr:uncharacterized protein MYCFIDRAFT_172527 [Pseudocercospora fijiensis CIRAD86]EME86837.1 hypothetical protein MYCFIDRAFT_172527 [Pseudocercospora fijiensis CIRAD86]
MNPAIFGSPSRSEQAGDNVQIAATTDEIIIIENAGCVRCCRRQPASAGIWVSVHISATRANWLDPLLPRSYPPLRVASNSPNEIG